MWYVRFRQIGKVSIGHNPEYGWRPTPFKWIQCESFIHAAAMARWLHKVGWKEIHLTKGKK